MILDYNKKVITKNMMCNILHVDLGSLVLSATSPYATYAASCNAFNLESIFDLHHAEWDWPKCKQFWKHQQHACEFCLW